MTPESARTELIKLSRRGDKDAFGRLYETYFPKIVSFLVKKTGDPESARDLAQDTFEKALRAVARFDGELKFQGWLFRIAVNTCIDYLRHEKKIPFASLDILLALGSEFENKYVKFDKTPETVILSRETRNEVALVLARLNPRDAQALILKEYFYLSYEKIAQMLNTTRAAVKIIIFRARRNFRKAWNDNQNSAKVTLP